MKDVVLDSSSFKALSSETRVGILKTLSRRRSTLSDLSKKFSLAPSTVKEHLDKLLVAGLVGVEEHSKWKSYFLTMKGRALVFPATKGFLVVLGVSLLVLTLGTYGLIYTSLAPRQYSVLSAPQAVAEKAFSDTEEARATGAVGEVYVGFPTEESRSFFWEWLVFSTGFLATALCVALLYSKWRWLGPRA